MENKVLEILYLVSWKIRSKIFKSKKSSPIALVLQPHPIWRHNNNKVVVETFNILKKIIFLCRFDFRGSVEATVNWIMDKENKMQLQPGLA